MMTCVPFSNRPSTAKRKTPLARRAAGRNCSNGSRLCFAEMGIERAGHGDIAKRAGVVDTGRCFTISQTRAVLVGSGFWRDRSKCRNGDVASVLSRRPETGNVRRHRIPTTCDRPIKIFGLVERKPGAAKTFLKWGVSLLIQIFAPTYLAFQTRMLDFFLVAYLPDNPEDPAKARAEARILYGAANLLSAMAFD